VNAEEVAGTTGIRSGASANTISCGSQTVTAASAIGESEGREFLTRYDAGATRSVCCADCGGSRSASN